jgi:single-strand DNA-binding protein
MSINTVAISGNLTRDIEVRYTQSGTAIGSFSVAVNERVKNQQTGEWEDRPNYIDVSLFGQRAQSLQQYLVKGTKVCVSGKLRWHQWQDKSGQNRSKVDVIADGIEFMSRNQNGGQNGYQQPQQQRQQQGYQQPQYVEATVYDEYSDIPF